MHISWEGLEYRRYLFKSVQGSETGGCHADVYLPSEGSRRRFPVAMYIHGGGFCLGDSTFTFKGHTKYLLDRGLCVVSVEYRLAPHARFKDMREDWVDAYRWIIRDLAGLTDAPIDPSSIMVFGGSAGGTATLFLGMDVALAGLPLPKAMYVVYPAVNWNTMWAEKEIVDYALINSIIAEQTLEHQAIINDFLIGPVGTGYDFFRTKPDDREKHGRWIWAMLAGSKQFLIPCILESTHPPYPAQTSWLDNVTSNFPPVVFLKALGDTSLDPAQTTLAFHRLQELGVDTIEVEAKGMLHGDVEGENDMALHPPREEYFWKDVFPVALDWCIKRTIFD